ncbi:Hypothetical protein PFCIRM139_11870 [Propionibacterium freudenreichii]|nr:Hypothetical protein PFCIRM139_11870 [Propionibacterium freudenreichii]SBN44357.1 Hypothetical protein PFR_J18_1896 [Propionibacterium freudenreichii]SBW76413.1 Hypothetical protein PFR_JS22-1_765 [Propionibacterium freudenreichii]
MTRDSTSDPLVGDVLAGRYEIVRKLARGGMATVYRARDRRLGRVVAVKVMHEGLGDDADFARKFDREARAVARLSDPHVVGVFDQGRDHGRPYIVMEFVEGCTLRNLITREAPFSPARALELIEPVVAALAAAHESGLVHRDVKPENVLIGPHGQVKVADFGLARAVTAQTVTAAHGLVIGTVSYLPPELVTNGHADARSDIYSTGVVLYELLTGEKPYAGDTPIQVAYAHVNKAVPPPSVTLRRTNHAPVPDYIDALTVACTRREPGQRPRDGIDLLARLRRARMALAAGVGNDPSLSAIMNPAAFRSSQVWSGSPTTRVDVVHTEPVATRQAALPAQHVAGQQLAGAATGAAATVPAPRLAATMGASTGSATNSGGIDVLAARQAAPSAPPTPRTARSTADPVRPMTAGWRAMSAGSGPRTPVSPVDFRARLAADPDAQLPRSGRTPRFPELVNDPVHRRRRGIVATVLVILIALGVGCLSWWLASGRYVSAPAVIGMNRTVAQGAAQKVGVTISFSEDYDDAVPAGDVVRTTPEAGSRMVRKDELHAVISQGPQSYPMPTVVGLDKDAATRAVADAHLRVGTIRQDYDADHAEGIVSGASATPGSQVRHDATVDLTVSRGPAPVKVPGLSGKTRDDATAALDALGLKADVSTQHSDAVASGSVISQDPADGELRPGDTVKVVVSDGGAPTDVPDVRVRSTADAHKVLEAAGFHVDEVMVDPDARIRLGRVQRTDPDPGSKLPKGATVKIFII